MTGLPLEPSLGGMSDAAENPAYLSTREAAKYLRVQPSTLIRWRKKEHRGPPVIAVSVNRRLYSRASLDAFMREKEVSFETKRADARP